MDRGEPASERLVVATRGQRQVLHDDEGRVPVARSARQQHLGDREPPARGAQRAQPLRFSQEQVRRARVVPLREPVAARGADADGVVDAAAGNRLQRANAELGPRRARGAARPPGNRPWSGAGPRGARLDLREQPPAVAVEEVENLLERLLPPAGSRDRGRRRPPAPQNSPAAGSARAALRGSACAGRAGARGRAPGSGRTARSRRCAPRVRSKPRPRREPRRPAGRARRRPHPRDSRACRRSPPRTRPTGRPREPDAGRSPRPAASGRCCPCTRTARASLPWRASPASARRMIACGRSIRRLTRCVSRPRRRSSSRSPRFA